MRGQVLPKPGMPSTRFCIRRVSLEREDIIHSSCLTHAQFARLPAKPSGRGAAGAPVKGALSRHLPDFLPSLLGRAPDPPPLCGFGDFGAAVPPSCSGVL